MNTWLFIQVQPTVRRRHQHRRRRHPASRFPPSFSGRELDRKRPLFPASFLLRLVRRLCGTDCAGKEGCCRFAVGAQECCRECCRRGICRSQLCRTRIVRAAFRQAAVHYGTKPGHFETSKIHFPTSERTSEWPSTYVSILVCSRP